MLFETRASLAHPHLEAVFRPFRGPRLARAALIVLLVLPGIAAGADRVPEPVPGTAPTDSLAARYAEASTRLITAARASSDAYDNLAVLTDEIGNRLSGSENLNRAIDWALDLMRREGFANVHAESIMVPVWVRGEESASITAPVRHELQILGLGRSVGTPPGGITAPVEVVHTFAELDSLGTRVEGKIVLFDAPFVNYGTTVAYRVRGPSRAAHYGAVAVLVRSITPVSLATPHTGTLYYFKNEPRIPAAAVTLEDADLIRRMTERGDTVWVHLTMGARNLPDAPSANVIGEIPGSERPEEIILLGAHLDSWDVGQGAQDDGSGCLAVLEAAHLIGRLGLNPRRTIRVVFFVNEENGLRGGRGYRDRHTEELKNHVAALESDSGNGAVQGFDFDLRVPEARKKEAGADARLAEVRAKGLAVLEGLVPLLRPLGAGNFRAGGSGADVEPSVEDGVPALGVRHDMSRYFDIHHTWADTFDKIDKGRLDDEVAAVAIVAYVLADMPGRLPRFE
jgi:carboxypeptidase Q